MRRSAAARSSPDTSAYSASICGETDSGVTGIPGTLCDEHRVIFVAASGQVRFGGNTRTTTRHSKLPLHRGPQRGSANLSYPDATGYRFQALGRRGVRAAGAGRPGVPARPGPAGCPRAGRVAPGRDHSGLLAQPPPTPEPPSIAFPRTADQSSACLLPGFRSTPAGPVLCEQLRVLGSQSGVPRDRLAAFSGVMLGACS